MITINMQKAKEIGHKIRRELRAKEFEPHDKIIVLQIPGANHVAAEAARQAIRDKYAVIQGLIDSSNSTEEIKQALGV